MIVPLICLALNIYFEARGDSILSQVATAQVVMNRVKDDRYPNDVCSVVTQSKKDKKGFPIRDKCQFSWYCDGKSDKPTDKTAWKQSKTIAGLIIDGQIFDLTQGSTHYHAYWVTPNWKIKKQFTAKIGDHIFYKWEN
tara:strand:+ start:3024 stop:3437 length:414 start_codon:yes stop_codon:yes gene_type:complete